MNPPERPRLVFVTGLSGSGKSTVLRALEDANFYCVDNLPIPLIRDLLEETRGIDQVAVAADLRSLAYQQAFLRTWTEVQAQHPNGLLLFLDADAEVLERRFTITRRPHPLAGPSRPVREAILEEKRILEEIKNRATVYLNTTDTNVHELRSFILNRFNPNWAKEKFLVHIMSFGYSFGVPSNADIVIDVRFLPNPYFVPHLRDFTGEHPDVAAYVLGQERCKELVQRILSLIAFYLPEVQKEHRTHFTVGIGCTGGRHRSVAIANAVAGALKGCEVRIHVMHRDAQRGEG
jgi:UPF0042 nucleotide-binding protein